MIKSDSSKSQLWLLFFSSQKDPYYFPKQKLFSGRKISANEFLFFDPKINFNFACRKSFLNRQMIKTIFLVENPFLSRKIIQTILQVKNHFSGLQCSKPSKYVSILISYVFFSFFHFHGTFFLIIRKSIKTWTRDLCFRLNVKMSYD